MKYSLKIKEDVSEVTTGASIGDGHIQVDTEERKYDISYRPAGEYRYLLVVNGKVLEAFVVRDREGKQIFLNGRSFHVKDADGLPSRARRGRGLDESPGEVTPPMPAVVVRIVVQEGDLVERGQGLVVVSAMKMETTLCAPFAGEVMAINTSVGERVAPGEILVEIAQETMKNE